MEEESNTNLWVGGFFLECQHLNEHVAKSERKFPVDLRPASKPLRAKPVRSLHRTCARRISDASHRLGLPYLRRLRTRLPLHDLARTFQRSIAQAQQLLRVRYADGLSRHLRSADFQGNECTYRSDHFLAGHRSAARAEQSHVESFARLWIRQLHTDRNFHDQQDQQ